MASSVPPPSCARAHWSTGRPRGSPASRPTSDCVPGFSAAVRAELLRRVGRFAESAEGAFGALAQPGVPRRRPARARLHRRSRGARRSRAARSGRRLRRAGGRAGSAPGLACAGHRLPLRSDRGVDRRAAPARARTPGSSRTRSCSTADGYYVQVLVRGESLQVYAEAADLDAHGTGTLSEPQRELLERLGWTRPGDGRSHRQLLPRVQRRDA